MFPSEVTVCKRHQGHLAICDNFCSTAKVLFRKQQELNDESQSKKLITVNEGQQMENDC